MTKEEILGMITLAVKYKNPNSFLLKLNLLKYCRLSGKLLKSGSFLYSINFKKSIIPFERLWNTLLLEKSIEKASEYAASKANPKVTSLFMDKSRKSITQSFSFEL